MKNTKISYHKNREMNKDTYALRRMVMNFVYEAKDLVPTLPRIEIRITDCDCHNVLGTARLNDCVVWIPASTLKMPQDDIRQVVFHEILHAAYGAEHHFTKSSPNDTWVELTYNPYKYKTFVVKATEVPVFEAKKVILKDKKIFAVF